MSLEDIRRSLDESSFDRKQALPAQRRALETRAQEAAAMIRVVDRALEALESSSARAGS